MSEFPQMMIRFHDGELVQEVIATSYNSKVLTFMGELACFDHVLVEMGDIDEDETNAMVVKREHGDYLGLAKYMIDKSFPLVLNQVHIPEYIKRNSKKFPPTIIKALDGTGRNLLEIWRDEGANEQHEPPVITPPQWFKNLNAEQNLDELS